MAKKALVVDDHTNIVILIKAKLKANGFDVLSASRGSIALEIAEKETPDIILLDIMMPGMDGFEVFSKLKEKDATKDIPVIFLTASAQKSDEIRARDMRAAHFLRKPFSPNELLQIINQVLG